MDKITLSDILSGFNLNKINDNFRKVEDFINDKVLQRNGDVLRGDLDVNNKRLYNLAVPTRDHEAARLKDVRNALYGAAGHTANLINFEPTGDITATNVQGAIAEVDAHVKDVGVSVARFGAKGDGVQDDTSAFRAAVASLNKKPGTIIVPKGLYKVTGKVSCYAGQNFISDGAVLDVSSYNGIFLSYNEEDTFNFTMFHPPTLIQGFKVMGKVSIDSPNLGFIFVKINRTPYVTVRDLVCYYAAAIWVTDESILCTFDSIRCYNPVSDCIAFGLSDTVNRFAPNGCSIVNSHFEEQKYPCTGINVAAGAVNVDNCYLESLSTLFAVSGISGLSISQTGMGLRYQAGSTAIRVDSDARLSVTGCNLTFAGGWSATQMIGLNLNANVELTFNNNIVTGLFAASDTGSVFSLKGAITGTINDNVFEQKGFGSTLTIFSPGDVQGAYYGGTFNNNHVEGKAGTTTVFSPSTGAAGVIQPHILGNKFIRVSSFRQLSQGLVSNNTFDGAPDTISWTGHPGGVVTNNRFYNPGWTLQNVLSQEGNFGLFDSNLSSNPYVSAYLSDVTPIASGVATRVPFNVEEYDTNASYDTSTGRFQPRVAGLYRVHALLAWYPTMSGVTQQEVRKNGQPYLAGSNNPTNTNGYAQEVEGYVYLNGSTDYIDVWVTQTSGSTISLAASNLNGTRLQISYVRSL